MTMVLTAWGCSGTLTRRPGAHATGPSAAAETGATEEAAGTTAPQAPRTAPRRAHVPLPLPAEPAAGVGPGIEEHAPASARASAAELADALHYADQFGALPAEQQQREMADAERRYGQEETPDNLLRFAFATTLYADGTNAEASAAASRVQAGLQAYLDDAQAAGEREGTTVLVELLLHVLKERERLLEEKVELQGKLNQLKAIEQQLRERDNLEAIPIAQ